MDKKNIAIVVLVVLVIVLLISIYNNKGRDGENVSNIIKDDIKNTQKKIKSNNIDEYLGFWTNIHGRFTFYNIKKENGTIYIDSYENGLELYYYPEFDSFVDESMDIKNKQTPDHFLRKEGTKNSFYGSYERKNDNKTTSYKIERQDNGIKLISENSFYFGDGIYEKEYSNIYARIKDNSYETWIFLKKDKSYTAKLVDGKLITDKDNHKFIYKNGFLNFNVSKYRRIDGMFDSTKD